MIRIVIHGAAGRMGRNLLSACLDDPALELVAALDHAHSECLGMDTGTLIGRPANGVVISTADNLPDFDVAIDFTRPEGTLAIAELCKQREAGLVIGTTGFDPDQKARIGETGRDIPVLLAPNMGVGVNLLFGLVEQAARVLDEKYDIEIIEAHHRHKVDAPSGTALGLGEAAASGRSVSLSDRAVYAREGITGERETGTIGFSAIRGGDIVGEHTVLFAATGERIEITHRATSRSVFAQGAMRAAAWLKGRPAGLYDMQDVLGLV